MSNIFLSCCLSVFIIACSSVLGGETRLSHMDSFLVRYLFESEGVGSDLKEEMVRSLQQVGKVFPSNDEQLTGREKKEKYAIGSPILEITVYTIAEENLSSPPKYTSLPVIEVEVKVIAGAEVLSNQQKIPIAVWEKQLFIHAQTSKQELSQKLQKALSAVLDQFARDYTQANPDPKHPPRFFLDRF